MAASNRDVIADILEDLGHMAGAETLRWTDERFESADCEIDAETLDKARAEAEQFGDTLRYIDLLLKAWESDKMRQPAKFRDALRMSMMSSGL